MKPSERYAWIEKYMRSNSRTFPCKVDVTHAAFVDDYIAATHAPCDPMPYGADKCFQLGRDLSAMHKAGRLTRFPCGLEGVSGMGFPKWVYIYSLAQHHDNQTTPKRI